MSSKRAGVFVLAVLGGMGLGLVIPKVNHWRGLANGQETLAKLKNLGLAMHKCNDTQRLLPPAYDAFRDITYPVSVHVHLLPYIGRQDLYKTFLQKGNGLTNASVPEFVSSSDATLGAGYGVQNYAANLRVFSGAGNFTGIDCSVPLAPVMSSMAGIPRSFTNTSSTVAFATKYAECNQPFDAAAIVMNGGSRFNADPTSRFAAFFGESPAEAAAHPSNPTATFQLQPSQLECRVWPLMGQSFGLQGIHVAMADASVRTVAPKVAVKVWNESLQPFLPTPQDW